MANSTGLMAHLPYLRRYARALCGDQDLGDACVRATLKSLTADHDHAALDAIPRVALYNRFQDVWRSTAGQVRADPHEPSSQDVAIAMRRLLRMPPRSRQAFLLTAVEGFSHADAASVLDTDVDELETRIAEAQAEIEGQLATDVLIIEDEPLIAADIEALLGELGHRVIGVMTTRDEAIRWMRDHTPGLVMSDVELADGSSGLDAVREILADRPVPVIFVTAFPERLMTGERPEPTFLITKPFKPKTLKAVIGQALFFHPSTPDLVTA